MSGIAVPAGHHVSDRRQHRHLLACIDPACGAPAGGCTAHAVLRSAAAQVRFPRTPYDFEASLEQDDDTVNSISVYRCARQSPSVTGFLRFQEQDQRLTVWYLDSLVRGLVHCTRPGTAPDFDPSELVRCPLV